MKKSYIILGAVLALALCLSGCEKKEAESDADLKKKLEDANEKVNEEFSDEFTYTEVEHGIAITGYKGEGGDLEIPEEIDGKTVVKIENTAFSDESKLTSLTIPASVQWIKAHTLKEGSSVKIRGYQKTAAIDYARSYGLEYEILGENTKKASYVLVYDTNGTKCTTIEPGKESKEEYAKGISMKNEDNTTVLTLDGCNAGSIVVEEYAALVIELAGGSENTLSAGAGLDGISTSGDLTIRGNGTLYVNGSDYYTTHDGENGQIGWGMIVYGNLTVEKGAKVFARCLGTEASITGFGVMVNSGNLIVDSASLNASVQKSKEADAGVLVRDDGSKQYGQIILKNCNITQGGQLVYLDMWGDYVTTIGTSGTTAFDEESGLKNAATAVVIE